MTSYCLAITGEGSIIHRLDCADLDLGTLLGNGCLAALGKYSTLPRALAAIRKEHPDAQPCCACCGDATKHLPQVWRAVDPGQLTQSS